MMHFLKHVFVLVIYILYDSCLDLMTTASDRFQVVCLSYSLLVRIRIEISLKRLLLNGPYNGRNFNLNYWY